MADRVAISCAPERCSGKLMAQGCAVSQRRSANPLRLAASLRLTHAVQRSMVSALAHTCTLALRLRSGDGVDAIPPKHKTETVTAASSHMATKPSKECALLADQADAPDTVVATGEGHWRAGVNRQAQAAAREHQVAASQAAAAKRKADAMTAEEPRPRMRSATNATALTRRQRLRRQQPRP